jgi:hypothetical protein
MKTLKTKDFNDKCALIADYTALNSHTDALIVLANMLGNVKYAKILYHIGEIHRLEGFLTPMVSEMRSFYAAMLFIDASHEFTAVQFAQIKGAL